MTGSRRARGFGPQWRSAPTATVRRANVVFIAAAILILLGGCSLPTGDGRSPARPIPQAEMVHRYIEAFNTGEPEVLAETLGELYVPEFLIGFGGATPAAWERLELFRTYGPLAYAHVDTLTIPPIVWTRGSVSRGWVGHQLFLSNGENPQVTRHSIWRVRPVPYAGRSLPDAGVADSMRSYLQRLSGAGHFSGSLSLSRHGTMLIDGSWGRDGQPDPAPITSGTRFYTASVTKLLTVTALLQLVEAGAVDLDDTLRRWIPDYPMPYRDSVRIRHLLTHTSGIELDDDADYLAAIRGARTADDLLRAQLDHLPGRDAPLAPGTEYDYTSEGIDLLGVIIERATGDSWTDVVSERVLEPAGMTRTRFAVPLAEGDWALGHTTLNPDLQTTTPGSLRSALEVLPVVPKPSSGAWSTAGDLHRFMRALLDHELLGPAWTDSLLTPQLETGELPKYGIRTWVGLGAQGEDVWGIRTVGHGGVVPGYSAAIEYLPESGWLLAVVSNTGEATAFLVFQRFLELVGANAARPSSDDDLTFTSSARLVPAAAYVDSLRIALELPALSVAVAENGRVVWEHATGWADPATARPATPSSVFRIGSVTKLLTAAALARLADRGDLDLDRPVRAWVPEAPESSPPITPRLLAGHLAGIRHYGRSEFVSRTHHPGVTATLGRFIDDPLVAPPGTRYSYSSFGYDLLGAVLERAAERDFRTLVHDEVVAPLGLRSVQAAGLTEKPGEVRYLFRDQGGTAVDAPFVDLSDRWPSGGYVATAPDLARFGSAVFGAGYLTEAGRKLMLTPMRTADGETTGVGLGWRLATDDAGRRIAHHGGEAMGSRAFVVVWPDEAVAVALMTNLSFAPIGLDEALRIAALVVP